MTPSPPDVQNVTKWNESISLLQCDCGQKSYIVAHDFNRPENLKFGTPYRCPNCKDPLGARHMLFEGSWTDGGL